MPKISILINADTRPQKQEAGALFDGVRSSEMLVPTVQNKINFFKGFDIETILWVDEHEHVTPYTLGLLREMCDCVVIRKHTKHYKGSEPFGKFNDVNYLQALSLARGTYIAHFDQDMLAFTEDRKPVEFLLNLLTDGGYKYVCYPSLYSPKCVDDPSFGNHIWASTRFFMCLKDTINLTELEQAICEPNAFYGKYGTPVRVNPWTEHFLGQSCGYSVFYPPISPQYLITPIHKYQDGVIQKLNEMPYVEVHEKLVRAGANTYHGVELDKIA